MSEEEAIPEANAVLSLTITVPDANTKPLSLQFVKECTVADVQAAFEMLPQAHHYTSFNFLYNGEILSSDIVLDQLVSNPKQKTLGFELKPRAYTERSLLEHLARIRDIAGLSKLQSFGINSGMSKFHELDLQSLKPLDDDKDKDQDKDDDKQITLPKPSPEDEKKIQSYLSSFFTQLPSNYWFPSPFLIPCVRSLHLSQWNPVPCLQKTHGDLVYLYLSTLEGENFHITGSTRGFYINKSSNVKFDPNPRDHHHDYHSFTLYDLIAKVSKNFIKQIKSNDSKYQSLDPATVSDPQTFILPSPWLTKQINITADYGRRDQHHQQHQHVYRDFNDEFQSVKELPCFDLQQRIIREKLMAETSHDFTMESVKGALGVIHGDLIATNPEEALNSQVFLKNGIFYSFGGVDGGAFRAKGGDSAARASSNQDLQALRFINSIDSKGIYTLLTTIVDYAGKRVVCQTPVPGLFTSSEPKQVKNEKTDDWELVEGEPLTFINYGCDDSIGEIKTDEDFVNGLKDISKALHFLPGEIDGVKLVTNPEVKGMKGIDKRKYILDLYNCTPLDIEFIEKHYNNSDLLSYPHRQTVVRLEAVQDWWANKTSQLIKKEAEAKGVDLNKLQEHEVTIEADKTSFTIDAFINKDKEDANVRELSQYITKTLIPKFLDQYHQPGIVTPMDGAHLSFSLHKTGINMRYLGEIARQLDIRIKTSLESELKRLDENIELNKKYKIKQKQIEDKVFKELQTKEKAQANGESPKDQEEKEDKEDDDDDDEDVAVDFIASSKQAEHVLRIVIQEMIARASKHILRKYSNKLPICLIPSLISHFHNCLLGTQYNATPEIIVENANDFYTDLDLEFTKLTPDLLQKAIEEDVKIHYRFQLPSDWIANISPLELQREIALKFGIQWIHRDYKFVKEESFDNNLTTKRSNNNKKQSTDDTVQRSNVFEPSDVSLVPIVKDCITRATTGEHIYDTARQRVLSKEDEVRNDGFVLLEEAVSVYQQIYGLVHPEVQRLYSSLSQLYQESNQPTKATESARKAAALAERVFGLDAHDTLVAYLNLAYLELEGGSLENSLKIYSRITQILQTVYQNKHSALPNLIYNAIIPLQEQGFIKQAIQLTSLLLKLTMEQNGENCYATGFLKFRLAFLYALCERYADAEQLSKESYEILHVVASDMNLMCRQAKDLNTRIEAYRRVQKLQAKANNNNNTQTPPPSASSQGQNKKKSKNDLSDKSVDELLKFIEGPPSSSSGKGNNKKKKKNKNKKK